MIFLDGATAENGPLCLLPGSRLSGRVAIDPADPIGQLADRSLIDADDALTMTVDAGSVVMFHGLLLHRSSPNRSTAHRRALRLTYKSVTQDREEGRPIALSPGPE